MTISTIYFKAEKIDQHCFSWTTLYQNNIEKRCRIDMHPIWSFPFFFLSLSNTFELTKFKRVASRDAHFRTSQINHGTNECTTISANNFANKTLVYISSTFVRPRYFPSSVRLHTHFAIRVERNERDGIPLPWFFVILGKNNYRFCE